ncbi:hypothetical protein D3C85_1418830 [compost metagenome]
MIDLYFAGLRMYLKTHRNRAIAHDVFVAGKREADARARLVVRMRPANDIANSLHHGPCAGIHQMGKAQGNRIDRIPGGKLIDAGFDREDIDVRAQRTHG